jgi:hypothetical protein
MRQRPTTTVAIVISNISNDPAPNVETRSVSVNDRLVKSASEWFIRAWRNVAACLQEFQATASDVLVKLELHATWSVGTGMMRSRTLPTIRHDGWVLADPQRRSLA